MRLKSPFGEEGRRKGKGKGKKKGLRPIGCMRHTVKFPLEQMCCAAGKSGKNVIAHPPEIMRDKGGPMVPDTLISAEPIVFTVYPVFPSCQRCDLSTAAVIGELKRGRGGPWGGSSGITRLELCYSTVQNKKGRKRKRRG